MTKRILFVDDEAFVLDGLRDLLRRERREWEMVFAVGGPAAVEELERGRFDVVVSDMRMPEIDGATLLALVQERHPDAVRIVLSGQTDRESAMRAVPVAHQFLSKPCDRGALRAAIERASPSQRLRGDDDARRVAVGTDTLPSPPTLYLELLGLVEDPEVTTDDVGALVQSDIAMSAKVLQLVNSSFFGLGRRVTSPREAVNYLGVSTLRGLILSVGAFRAFEPTARVEGFSVGELERHSAIVARVAAALVPGVHADAAFTAGLLHDIGKLMLASRQPAELAFLLDAAKTSRRPLHAVELERHGATHADTGAYLLGVWGLPEQVVDAVAGHHTTRPIDSARLDAADAVYLANLLVAESERRIDAAQALACAASPASLGSWRAIAAECCGDEGAAA